MPRKIVPVPVPPGHRWCFGCSRLLSLGAFSVERRNPEGRTMRCRRCRLRARRELRERQAIIEEAAARIEAAFYRQLPADPD